MNKLPEGDNPKQAAEKVNETYLHKGYNLDFTLKSLKNEINKV